MSNDNSNTGLSLGGQQFSVGGNLDVDAVLTVATSRAETKFQTELAAAKKVLKQVTTDHNKAVKAVEIALTAQSEALCNRHKATIEAGIKAMGGSVQSQPNGYLNQGKVTATINVKQHSGYGGCCNFHLEEEPGTEVLAAQSALERAAQAEEVALSWKRKLNNVPVLERQMKAKIAEVKLRDTEEGQAMLQALTDGLDDAILALPEA